MADDLNKVISAVAEYMNIINPTDDEVFVFIAIPRKKYNQDIPSGSDHRKGGVFREVITRKNFVNKVTRVYTLVKDYPHEIGSSSDYNFYISLNPRSPHKALVEFKKYLALYDYDPNAYQLHNFHNEWFSCLQKKSARSRKVFFMADIDDALISDDFNKWIATFTTTSYLVRTRNGHHFLFTPRRIDNISFPNVEFKTDALVFIGDMS
jgi:hypothetical protein